MLPAGKVDAICLPEPLGTIAEQDVGSIDSYPLTMDLPELQRVPDSMFQCGLTPGAKSAYQIIKMVQPEPGLISG
jgi:hypothetical protein